MGTILKMPIENPSLDSQTFEDLLNDAKKNLPIYSKTWTNYNESDPGITLLELLCWLADNQIYKLNRITKQNYLKFLKLLGEHPQKPLPAKLNVSFPSHSSDVKTILQGTKLISTHDEITFETESTLKLIPVNLTKVITNIASDLNDVTVLLEKKFFYGFGEFPDTGNSFLLGFDTAYDKKTDLNIGINLEKSIIRNKKSMGTKSDPDSIFYPSCKIQWKYLTNVRKDRPDWNVLDVVNDSTSLLTKSGIVSLSVPFDKMPTFDLDDSGEKLKWILCVLTDGSYEIPPKINSIKLNTVNAIQGWTERKSLGLSDGLPEQLFEISDNLIKIIQVEVKNVKSGNSSVWNHVETFDSSGPDDKHYTLDVFDNAIKFGDGIKGDIPYSGNEIILTYRHGSIRKEFDLNNVQLISADSQLDISHDDRISHTVISSGKKGEDIKEALLRTKHQLRLPTKAVNSNDYEYIVKNSGMAVDKVATVPDPKNNLVTVIVIPKSPLKNPIPSSGFLRTIQEHLNKHRMLTTQIKVSGPNYIQISVSVDVEIKETVDPLIVQKRINDSLNEFLSPVSNNRTQGWKFGRPVFRSEIYSIIKNICGVQFMTKPYLQASGKGGTFRYESGKIWIDKTSTVYPGTHSINIRYLNSKNMAIRKDKGDN